MVMEPYTIAAFVVSVASTVTAGAAVAAARYVYEARENSKKALRLLQGEQGVDDAGLVTEVSENREALMMAGMWPPGVYEGDEQ